MLSRVTRSRPQEVSLKPQPWRWNHPRVLIEHPDEATGLALASELRFAGYAVAVCPGPGGRGRCPLTGPEGCAPAHDADVVVCFLGIENETALEVLHELRTRYPDTPLIVEVPSSTDADLRELLDGCHPLPAPATPAQVVAAVQTLSGLGAPEDRADA
jgi:hypothetical protein